MKEIETEIGLKSRERERVFLSLCMYAICSTNSISIWGMKDVVACTVNFRYIVRCARSYKHMVMRIKYYKQNEYEK